MDVDDDVRLVRLGLEEVREAIGAQDREDREDREEEGVREGEEI